MRPDRRDCFCGRGAFAPPCSPQMPFRFGITSQSPPERLVSSEHPWDHYCICVRAMLGDGGGDQPPPSHAWRGCLITDILQEAWLEDQVTEAMALSPGEAILFFSRCSRNEGLPYCRARNVEFGLGGPFNWAGRPTQIEYLRKTMQEGCCVIIKAVVEKKMKTRGPGWLQGKARHPRTPAAAYNIKEWVWGLEGASYGEETVCMDRVNKVHSIQIRWGILMRVADQGRQEEASG